MGLNFIKKNETGVVDQFFPLRRSERLNITQNWPEKFASAFFSKDATYTESFSSLPLFSHFFLCSFRTCFSVLPFSDRKNVVKINILLDVTVAVMNSQTTHRETGRMFVCP